jgi:hypothetical protein
MKELIKAAQEKGYSVRRHTWGTQIFRENKILVSTRTDRELWLVLKALTLVED